MGKLILILKLGAFLAGASLSGPRFWFFGPDWYFGVFFGAVIVIWEARSLKDLIGGRSVAFLGVATGIHQGSVFVADRLFGNLPAIPLIDDLIRTAFDDESILVAGLLLSLALPFAHLRIWNARCRPAKIIAPCLFGAWFGICILIFNWRPWDDWVNVLSIWQAIYLACMFSPWPRFLVRRTHVSRATKSPFTSLSTIQVATFLFALAYTPAFNWLVAIWSPLFLISSVIGYVGFRYRIWQAWSLGWVVMPVALFLFVFDWLAWIVPESFDVGSFYDNDYEYLLGRIGFAIIALVLCESAMRTFSSSTRKVRSLSLSKLDSLLTFQLIGYNVVGILTILTFFSMEVLEGLVEDHLHHCDPDWRDCSPYQSSKARPSRCFLRLVGPSNNSTYLWRKYLRRNH